VELRGIVKVVAIIQARMGSTRLPGKVLMDLGGASVLSRVVHRLRRCSQLEEIVIATTDQAADQVIVASCAQLGVACFRGSETDVLDRYHRAAEAFSAGAVVRITSDCPLIDPAVVDNVIQTFLDKQADFACNVCPRMYPRGLDTEVFTKQALARVASLSNQPYQREHVTALFYEQPNQFRVVAVPGQRDYSHYRWTVDTHEDIQLLRSIYAHFDNRDDFSWQEAVSLLQQSPELSALNAHVQQKEVGPGALLARS
jgi:spore coat polysaccharide biosynthesis protein SpsF